MSRQAFLLFKKEKKGSLPSGNLVFLKFTCSQQQKEETLREPFRSRKQTLIFSKKQSKEQKQIHTETVKTSSAYFACAWGQKKKKNLKRSIQRHKTKQEESERGESSHQRVFSQSPTARLSHANCWEWRGVVVMVVVVGGGAVLLRPPSHDCQSEEIFAATPNETFCMKNSQEQTCLPSNLRI